MAGFGVKLLSLDVFDNDNKFADYFDLIKVSKVQEKQIKKNLVFGRLRLDVGNETHDDCSLEFESLEDFNFFKEKLSKLTDIFSLS